MAECLPYKQEVGGSSPSFGIMRQCVLRNRNRIKVAWIPVQFAIRGKWLRIHDEDGWQVVDIGTYQKDFRYQNNWNRLNNI